MTGHTSKTTLNTTPLWSAAACVIMALESCSGSLAADKTAGGGASAPDSTNARETKDEVDPTEPLSSTDGGADGASPEAVAEQGGEIADQAAADDPQDESLVSRELPSSTIRRLSNHELNQSYQQLLGFTPDATNTIPPDGLGYAFDRVVNGQTISRSHLDAFDAMATEAATHAIEIGSLDELSSACPDDILPPAAPQTTTKIVGAAFSLNPDWAVQAETGNAGSLLYAPEPTAAYSHTFPAAGVYNIELNVESRTQPVERAQLLVDDVAVATYEQFLGETTLSSSLTIEQPGPKLLLYQFFSGDNLGLDISSLTVTGPTDPNAEGNAERRQSCVDGLIADFAPLVFRRPLNQQEREQLGQVYAATLDNGFGSAITALLQALLTSPNFLYLIEVGDEVEGDAKVRKLDSWEVASRLSFALCEQPPDATLREAAQAGELQTTEQVRSQTERLLEQDCAQASLRRFFSHWLGLNRISELKKSPEVYPNFTPELRQAMQQEAERYIDEMLWNEQADFKTLLLSRQFWPTPQTAPFYALPTTGLSKEQFPDERAGILTLPAVLAVNSAFAESNPVLRAGFVLERMMCSLPPPPDFVVTAPVPDPNLTTRERWRAHSELEACAACHAQLDPVGFALEGFDGIGQYRTEENGQPIDDRGGLPVAGISDGELEGGAELAQAIADSPLSADCFARHWMRFVLGRLESEQSTDADTLNLLTESLNDASMLNALSSLTTTDSFLYLSQGETP